MISSAVVIPEPPQPASRDPSQSSTLKRKFSETTGYDRKRPRVDTTDDTLNYDDERKSPVPATATTTSTATNTTSATPQSANATSPSQPPRRSSALSRPSVAEEKKRNQRLFGGILGVVSQRATTASPAHKRREEIEARARERLKRETEEQEAERKRRKQEAQQRREKQQKAWEEESMRIRHANMRAMAAFLKTKTEPSLFYKPWELRPEEEETLRRQKEQVEEQIRKDLGLTDARSPSRVEEPLHNGPLRNDKADQEETTDQEAGQPDPRSSGRNEDQGLAEEMTEQQSPRQDSKLDAGQGTDENAAESHSGMNGHDHHDEAPKDDEHHDEELVEGQEDDVIY